MIPKKNIVCVIGLHYVFNKDQIEIIVKGWINRHNDIKSLYIPQDVINMIQDIIWGRYFEFAAIGNIGNHYNVEIQWNCDPVVKVLAPTNIFVCMPSNFADRIGANDIIENDRLCAVRFIHLDDGFNGVEAANLGDVSFGFIGYNGNNSDYKQAAVDIITNIQRICSERPDRSIITIINKLKQAVPGVYKLSIDYDIQPKIIAGSNIINTNIKNRDGQAPLPILMGDWIDAIISYNEDFPDHYQITFWRNDDIECCHKQGIISPTTNDLLLPYFFTESIPLWSQWKFEMKYWTGPKLDLIKRLEKMSNFSPIPPYVAPKNNTSTRPKKTFK